MKNPTQFALTPYKIEPVEEKKEIPLQYGEFGTGITNILTEENINKRLSELADFAFRISPLPTPVGTDPTSRLVQPMLVYAGRDIVGDVLRLPESIFENDPAVNTTVKNMDDWFQLVNGSRPIEKAVRWVGDTGEEIKQKASEWIKARNPLPTYEAVMAAPSTKEAWEALKTVNKNNAVGGTVNLLVESLQANAGRIAAVMGAAYLTRGKSLAPEVGAYFITDFTLGLQANIDESINRGVKDPEKIINNAMFKQIADSGMNALLFGGSTLQWASTPVKDILSKWLLNTVVTPLQYGSTRRAVGETVTDDEIIKVGLVNMLMSAPLDTGAAVLVGKASDTINYVGKKLKPGDINLIQGEVVETKYQNALTALHLNQELKKVRTELAEIEAQPPMPGRDALNIKAWQSIIDNPDNPSNLKISDLTPSQQKDLFQGLEEFIQQNHEKRWIDDPSKHANTLNSLYSLTKDGGTFPDIKALIKTLNTPITHDGNLQASSGVWRAKELADIKGVEFSVHYPPLKNVETAISTAKTNIKNWKAQLDDPTLDTLVRQTLEQDIAKEKQTLQMQRGIRNRYRESITLLKDVIEPVISLISPKAQILLNFQPNVYGSTTLYSAAPDLPYYKFNFDLETINRALQLYQKADPKVTLNEILLNIAHHEVKHNFMSRAMFADKEFANGVVLAYVKHLEDIVRNPTLDNVRAILKMLDIRHDKDTSTGIPLFKQQPPRTTDAHIQYFMNFREFIAEVGGKIFLAGDFPGLKEGLKSALLKYKPAYDKLTENIKTKLYPADSQGLRAFNSSMQLFDIKQRLSEEIAYLKGQTVDNWLSVYSPKTQSALWDVVGHLPELEYSILENLVLNKPVRYSNNTPEINQSRISDSERRAMASTIHKLRLDQKPKEPVDMSLIAKVYDQYLKYEHRYQEWWDGLSPVSKFLRDKVLNQAPSVPRILEDMTYTGKVASWGYSLLQMGQENPNNRYLQQHIALTRKGVAIRTQIFKEAEPFIRTIASLPMSSKERLARYLGDESNGVIKAQVTERVKLAKDLALNRKQPFDSAAVTKNILRTIVFKDYGLSPYELQLGRSLFAKMKETILQRKEAHLADFEFKQSKGQMTPEEVDENVAKISSMYQKLANRNYWPSMRFGEHVLTVKVRNGAGSVKYENFTAPEGTTLYREHFESVRERNAAQLALIKELELMQVADKVNITVSTLMPELRTLRGIDWGFLQETKDAVVQKLYDIGVGKEKIGEAQRTIDDIIKTYSSDNAFARRLMSRRGVRGASHDVERVLASYMEAFANDFARLSFKAKSDQNIKDFHDFYERKYADTRGKTDAEAQKFKEEIAYDYMLRHNDYMYHPGNEFDVLKTIGFVYHLGFSVVAAGVNFSSVPIYTHNYLSRDFGDAKSLAALSKALIDVTASRVTKSPADILDPEIFAALERLRVQGTLDQTATQEMASMAMGGLFEKLGGLVGATKGKMAGREVRRFAHSLVHASGYMFQGVEALSREVSAVAALRLAKDSGITNQTQLVDYATKVVDNALFEYGRHNRARIFRGPTSAFLLFQQFVTNSLYYLTRKNSSALKASAMLLAAGGLMGIPGAEDLADMADIIWEAIPGQKEKMPDIRLALREFLTDIGANPDLIMNGMGRNFFGTSEALSTMSGMEVPQFDISKNITSGRLIPFNAMESIRSAVLDVNKQDTVGQLTQNVTGATGAPFWNLITAWRHMPDAWKTTESMLPRFMREASQGIRWMSRGNETDLSGTELIDFDRSNPTHLMEGVGKMLGLNPRRITASRELNRSRFEHHTYWQVQRAGLLDMFRRAYEAGLQTPNPSDNEIHAIQKEIMLFNEQAPPEYVIQQKTLQQSIKQKLRRSQLERMGYISGTIQSAGQVELDRYFPDVNQKQTIKIEPTPGG